MISQNFQKPVLNQRATFCMYISRRAVHHSTQTQGWLFLTQFLSLPLFIYVCIYLLIYSFIFVHSIIHPFLFIHPRPCPLCSSFLSPKHKFPRMSPSPLSSYINPRSAVLRLIPSIFLWVFSAFVFPPVPILGSYPSGHLVTRPIHSNPLSSNNSNKL
jgi:hypothetical protein